MIDLRTLRENPEAVRASQRARGEDPSLVDALLSADERRRSAVSRADSLRGEQKTLGKQPGSRYNDWGEFAQALSDRKSTRLNSSHLPTSRMPSSA